MAKSRLEVVLAEKTPSYQWSYSNDACPPVVALETDEKGNVTAEGYEAHLLGQRAEQQDASDIFECDYLKYFDEYTCAALITNTLATINQEYKPIYEQALAAKREEAARENRRIHHGGGACIGMVAG